MPATEIVDLVLQFSTLFIGLLLCFRGYSMFRLALACLFGVLGSYAGNEIYSFTKRYFISSDPEKTRLIIVGTAIVLCALMSYALYTKAVVLLTTIAGCYLFYNGYISVLIDPNGMSKVRALLIGLGIGLVFGIAVRFIQRIAIKAFTALVGAKLIADFVVPYALGVTAISNFSSKVCNIISDNSKVLAPNLFIQIVLIIIFFFWGISNQKKIK